MSFWSLHFAIMMGMMSILAGSGHKHENGVEGIDTMGRRSNSF